MAFTRLVSLGAYTGAALIGRGLSISVILIYANSMPVASFGVYSFFQVSCALVITVAGLNLSTPISVSLAKNRGGRVRLENSIYVIVVILLSFIAIAVGMASVLLFPGHLVFDRYLLLFFLIQSAAGTTLNLTSATLIARDYKMASVICASMPAGVSVLWASAYPPATTEAGMALMSIAMTVGASVALAIFLRAGLTFDLPSVRAITINYLRRNSRKLFAFSMSLFGASFLFQFSLWFLQRQLLEVGGAAENAVFAIANQFYNVAIFLPGVFGPILLRRLSAIDSDTRRRKEVLNAFYIASTLCVGGLCAFPWLIPLLELFLPARYNIGVAPLMLAIAAGAAMFSKFPISIYFQSRVMGSPELIASLISAALIVAGASFTIVIQSADRAMIVRVLAHTLQMFLVLIYFLIAFAPQQHGHSKNEH